jgi:hypothetical protein
VTVIALIICVPTAYILFETCENNMMTNIIKSKPDF